MDGSVVRSLASHQRGLSLNPGPGMFIVGSHLPPRFFLQFSSLHKFKFGQETADERSLQTHSYGFIYIIIYLKRLSGIHLTIELQDDVYVS